MTETQWRRASRDFADRLVAIKAEAGRLGLFRTMHGIDHGTQALGWEIADIEAGRQIGPWKLDRPRRRRRK